MAFNDPDSPAVISLKEGPVEAGARCAVGPYSVTVFVLPLP